VPLQGNYSEGLPTPVFLLASLTEIWCWGWRRRS